MTTKYASLTPYNFSFNDPVTFTDVSGADPWDFGPYAGNSAYYYAMQGQDGMSPGQESLMDPGGYGRGGGGVYWNPRTAGGYGMEVGGYLGSMRLVYENLTSIREDRSRVDGSGVSITVWMDRFEDNADSATDPKTGATKTVTRYSPFLNLKTGIFLASRNGSADLGPQGAEGSLVTHEHKLIQAGKLIGMFYSATFYPSESQKQKFGSFNWVLTENGNYVESDRIVRQLPKVGWGPTFYDPKFPEYAPFGDTSVFSFNGTIELLERSQNAYRYYELSFVGRDSESWVPIMTISLGWTYSNGSMTLNPALYPITPSSGHLGRF